MDQTPSATRKAMHYRRVTPPGRKTARKCVEAVPFFGPNNTAAGRGLAARAQALGGISPIHDVPERRNVFRTSVLILEVIGVLPDVQAQNGAQPFDDGAVLVGKVFDGQLAGAVGTKPGPATAEPARRRVGEFLFE